MKTLRIFLIVLISAIAFNCGDTNIIAPVETDTPPHKDYISFSLYQRVALYNDANHTQFVKYYDWWKCNLYMHPVEAGLLLKPDIKILEADTTRINGITYYYWHNPNDNNCYTWVDYQFKYYDQPYSQISFEFRINNSQLVNWYEWEVLGSNSLNGIKVITTANLPFDDNYMFVLVHFVFDK